MQNRTQLYLCKDILYHSGLFIKNRTNMHEMQNRLDTEYDAIYGSKLRAKMYQNACVDFKLG